MSLTVGRNAQTLPTFLTAPLDYRASRRGLHSTSESVRPTPRYSTGLISPLRHNLISDFRCLLFQSDYHSGARSKPPNWILVKQEIALLKIHRFNDRHSVQTPRSFDPRVATRRNTIQRSHQRHWSQSVTVFGVRLGTTHDVF